MDAGETGYYTGWLDTWVLAMPSAGDPVGGAGAALS